MGRALRRTVAAAGAVAVSLVVWSVPSQAQDAEPPTGTNFNMTGIRDLGTAQMLTIQTDVSGQFAYCNNPNGLGAELYLEAGNGAGTSVRHATVTPFVVPLHIGLLRVTNDDPDNEVDTEMLTIGVARGTPVEFGSTGSTEVEYGGIYLGSAGAGLVNWRQSGTISCDDSVVMPVLRPYLGGGTSSPTEPASTEPPPTDPPPPAE